LARARAELIAGYGFAVNFAPVADVAYDAGSSMADRAFGADPALVAAKVGAFIAGTWGTGVHHTVKHFPGHGRATLDSHDALPTVELSHQAWRTSDARPFQAAITAGVELAMLGHLRYPQWDEAPASLSAVAVEVLRGELGFAGVVVSDDLGMAALAAIDPFEVVDRVIAAGVDLLLYVILPVPASELIEHVVGRVEAGEVPVERIDQSVGRLLRLRLARTEH
jgi:beta-N-acetylhexosaminidase